jgi:hypothetical protein
MIPGGFVIIPLIENPGFSTLLGLEKSIGRIDSVAQQKIVIGY